MGLRPAGGRHASRIRAVSRHLPNRVEQLRQSFWALPAIGMAVGVIGGFLLVEADYRLGIDPGVFTFVDLQSARAVLETIATVTVSVAGLAFSVTVVALQLASQQLSPRVLRTFQDDRLAQSVLAVFVGTFVYALIVLAKLTERGVPALSVTVAILAAIVAFGLFVAFIHHIIVSLKASTVLKRISRDGRQAVRRRWPDQVGEAPSDPAAARERLRARLAASEPTVVASPRAGYLSGIDGAELVALAAREDLVVEQRARIGDFALTGGALADVGGRGDVSDEVVEAIAGCFALDDERSVSLDVAYPIRQLADVALRALSPSLNDPTTAENALASMADLLVLFAEATQPEPIRCDGDGHARLATIVPDLDDLARIGFEQVRLSAAPQPVVLRSTIELLEEVTRRAGACAASTRELERQTRLFHELLGDESRPGSAPPGAR